MGSTPTASTILPSSLASRASPYYDSALIMVQEIEVCAELERLRETGRRLRQRLRDSRRKSKEFAEKERREAPRNSGRSADFESYLQRKIQRTASEIERHISEHGCHDLGSA